MLFDRYTREARLYPAIATLPPFLLLYNFGLHQYISSFVSLALGLVIGGVSVSIALIFLLMEVNRFISKMILEARYFQNEQKMPTTNLLLFKDNTYSDEHKKQIRKKIQEDFGITLLSKHDEAENETRARQRITEAVSMIRTKMKEGHLILQHNIHYGAARNLIGGSILAFIVSIIDVVWFGWFVPNQIAIVLSIVFAAIYGTLIALGKYIVMKQG